MFAYHFIFSLLPTDMTVENVIPLICVCLYWSLLAVVCVILRIWELYIITVVIIIIDFYPQGHFKT